MFATPNNFGELGSLKKSFRKLAKAVGQPVKLLKKPKDALSLKKQWKAGVKIGKSLENVAVDLNPLDPYMKRLDEAGIKAGRKGNVVAKVLGRVGEKARTKPIATTAIVYTAALGVGKALAAKAAAAAKGGAAAVGTAGGGSSAGASGSLLSQAASGMTTASKAVGLVGAGKQMLAKNEQGEVIEEMPVEPIQASMLPNKEVGIIAMLASMGIGAYFILKNR